MQTNRFTSFYPNKEYQNDYSNIREKELINDFFTNLKELNPDKYKTQKASIYFDNLVSPNGLNLSNNFNTIIVHKLIVEFQNDIDYDTDILLKLKFNNNIITSNNIRYDNSNNVDYDLIYLPSLTSYTLKKFYRDFDYFGDTIVLNIDYSRLGIKQNFELNPTLEIYDTTSTNQIVNFKIFFDLYYVDFR